MSLSLCMCCSSHMSLWMIIFASLILGIPSETVYVFMCPKHTWWFSLFDVMRSVVSPGRSLIVFTGFVLCCNVTNNVVPFSPFLAEGHPHCNHCNHFPPFQGFFCRCYMCASLVLQQQLSQFLHVLPTQPCSLFLTAGFTCKLCNTAC